MKYLRDTERVKYSQAREIRAVIMPEVFYCGCYQILVPTELDMYMGKSTGKLLCIALLALQAYPVLRDALFHIWKKLLIIVHGAREVQTERIWLKTDFISGKPTSLNLVKHPLEVAIKFWDISREKKLERWNDNDVMAIALMSQELTNVLKFVNFELELESSFAWFSLTAIKLFGLDSSCLTHQHTQKKKKAMLRLATAVFLCPHMYFNVVLKFENTETGHCNAIFICNMCLHTLDRAEIWTDIEVN